MFVDITWFVFKVGLLFAALQLSSASYVPCPASCLCRNVFSMACQPGMTRIPSSIPHTTWAVTLSGTNKKHNTFGQIVATDFQHLSVLKHLKLGFSEISALGDFAFSRLPGLKRLSINNNRILEVHNSTFAGLSLLETLDLSSNTACLIHDAAFSNLPLLRELFLGDMNLNGLRKDMFTGLQNLQVLDVHGNSLLKRHFPEDVFSVLPSLGVLDISINAFTSLSNQIWNQIAKLQSVYIDENPWHCNCEMKDVKDNQNLTQLLNSLVCATPTKLQYSYLTTVPKRDLFCQPPVITKCNKALYTVNVSQSLHIVCDVEGDPKPLLTWRSPDGRYFHSDTSSPHNYVFHNDSLTISSAGMIDNGEWIIQGTNREGIANKIINVSVLIAATTVSTTVSTKVATSSLKTAPRQSSVSMVQGTAPSTLLQQQHLPKQVLAAPGSALNQLVNVNVTRQKGQHGTLSTSKENNTVLKNTPVVTVASNTYPKTTGIIVGGVCGGLSLISISVLAIVLYSCKLRKNKVKSFSNTEE